METNKSETDIVEQCSTDGACSPPDSPVGGGDEAEEAPEQQRSNIDDISTPSDLKFDEFDFDDPSVAEKRKEIEQYLSSAEPVPREQWQRLARAPHGLVSDEYRRRVWPLLLGVPAAELTEPPTLRELAEHGEYAQVSLDVARSLKRFPPGVPYARRVALQDQLTALVLRVMQRHPRLHYYQGYHDVAVTLLLVCGARAAFPLLLRLSAGPDAPLEPFLRATMSATQRRLNCLLPLLRRRHEDLARHMLQAEVGTMFALPWYLTWFGHSLPRYAHVVRLYDYFLCAPPLAPVYVTAALVLHRAHDVLHCECDMAALHCLLARLPDHLPWEDILAAATDLYAEHPPDSLAADVAAMEAHEAAQRAAEEQRRCERAAARARRPAAGRAPAVPGWRARCVRALSSRYVLAAAAGALLGVCAYYRPELLFAR